jgi:hypothetical protein
MTAGRFDMRDHPTGASSLAHITLTTGHARASPRSEVGDHIVSILQPILERALKGERVPVPGQPGFTLSGVRHLDCCILTVWASAPDTARPQSVPVVTSGVAAGEAGAQELWRLMHETTDLGPATTPQEAPPAPWCADRIELGALRNPVAMSWTGDLARCLAWTWIEARAT